MVKIEAAEAEISWLLVPKVKIILSTYLQLFVSMRPLGYNKPLNMSAHVPKVTSNWIPESNTNRTTTHPWCVQQSVCDVWEYI